MYEGPVHGCAVDGPFFLPIVGAQDLVDFNPLQATLEFADQAPARSCTFTSRDDLYHEMHNEPQQGQVFETMIRWLNEKLTV